MATADQYAKWIVDNENQKGSDEFNTVAAAYKEAKAESSNESEYSMLDSGTRGAVQGATLGLADEIYGGVGSAYNAMTTDENYSDSYDRLTSEQRQKNDQAERENPASYFAGDMVGSAVLPAGIGMAAKGTKLGRAVAKGVDKVADVAGKTGIGKAVGKAKKFADDKVADASRKVASVADDIPGLRTLTKSKSAIVSKAEEAANSAAIKFREKAGKYREQMDSAKERLRMAKQSASQKGAKGRTEVQLEKLKVKKAKDNLKDAQTKAKALDKKASEKFKASEKKAKEKVKTERTKQKKLSDAATAKSKAKTAKVKAENKVKKDAHAKAKRDESSRVLKENNKIKNRNEKAKAKFVKDKERALKKGQKASSVPKPKLETLQKAKLKAEPRYKTVPQSEKALPKEVPDFKAGKPPKPSKQPDRRAAANAQSRLDRIAADKQPDLTEVNDAMGGVDDLRRSVPSKADMDTTAETLRQARLVNPPAPAILPSTVGEAIGSAVGGTVGAGLGPLGGLSGAALGVQGVRGLNKLAGAIKSSPTAKTAARLAGLSASGKAVQEGIETVQTDYTKANSDPVYATKRRLDKLSQKD